MQLLKKITLCRWRAARAACLLVTLLTPALAVWPPIGASSSSSSSSSTPRSRAALLAQEAGAAAKDLDGIVMALEAYDHLLDRALPGDPERLASDAERLRAAIGAVLEAAAVLGEPGPVLQLKDDLACEAAVVAVRGRQLQSLLRAEHWAPNERQRTWRAMVATAIRPGQAVDLQETALARCEVMGGYGEAKGEGRSEDNDVWKLTFHTGEVAYFRCLRVEPDTSDDDDETPDAVPAEPARTFPPETSCAVASYLVDVLIGAELIPATSRARFTAKDGTIRLGNLMAEAPGLGLGLAVNAVNSDHGRWLLLTQPRLQCLLSRLSLEDALCAQTDRHSNNVHVTLDAQGVLVALKGIDNDKSFGTDGLEFNVACDDHWRCLARQVDSFAAQGLLALREDELRTLLGPVLGAEELTIAAARLREIQQALAGEAYRLIPESAWSLATVEPKGDGYVAYYAEDYLPPDERATREPGAPAVPAAAR